MFFPQESHDQKLLLGDVMIATNQRHQHIAEGLRSTFQDTKEEIRNKVQKNLNCASIQALKKNQTFRAWRSARPCRSCWRKSWRGSGGSCTRRRWRTSRPRKRRGGSTRLFFLLIFVKLSRIHFKRFTQEFMDKDKKGLAEVVDNNRRILKLTARN